MKILMILYIYWTEMHDKLTSAYWYRHWFGSNFLNLVFKGEIGGLQDHLIVISSLLSHYIIDNNITIYLMLSPKSKLESNFSVDWLWTCDIHFYIFHISWTAFLLIIYSTWNTFADLHRNHLHGSCLFGNSWLWTFDTWNLPL